MLQLRTFGGATLSSAPSEFPTAGVSRVVFEGDSLTDGAPWVDELAAAFPGAVKVNVATSADEAGNMVTTFASQIAPHAPQPGQTSWFFLLAGINDLYYKEATVVYQQTIRRAFREVSDAIVGYRKLREFREQQRLLLASAEDALRLADVRYRGGAASYLEVLDADTRRFNAQLGLADAQFQELSSLVEIYRALGGGWSAP